MTYSGLATEHINIPPWKPRTRLQRITRGFCGAVFSPLYWAAASLVGAPGISFRWRCIQLALRLVARGQGAAMPKTIFELACWPLDSTRYFEFDFMWRAVARLHFSGAYLDISSPRLFPTLVLQARSRLYGTLLNPDTEDLGATSSLLTGLGMRGRASLIASKIEDAELPSEGFPLITCMSVLEHIPDDHAAIKRIWDLLAPGGRLLITLPCAVSARVQLADKGHYGAEMDGHGWSHFQYVYDEQLLMDRIISITGHPMNMELLGEKRSGILGRNLARKRSDPGYPIWQEPLFVAMGFRRYRAISELAGEGVLGLEFAKR